jgi:hypothetical protein
MAAVVLLGGAVFAAMRAPRRDEMAVVADAGGQDDAGDGIPAGTA